MILAAFILSAAIAAAPPKFDVTYDRFTNTTSIFASEALPSRKGDTFLILTSLHRGTKERPSNSVIYRIEVWAYRKDWDYLRCHSVAILADGKPVTVFRNTISSDVISANSVSEYISVAVDREAITAIADASKVELQVCRDEWLLPKSVSSKAQDIVIGTTPTSGPAAPPQ